MSNPLASTCYWSRQAGLEYMQHFPLGELTSVREKPEKDQIISVLPAQKHFGKESKTINSVKQGSMVLRSQQIIFFLPLIQEHSSHSWDAIAVILNASQSPSTQVIWVTLNYSNYSGLSSSNNSSWLGQFCSKVKLEPWEAVSDSAGPPVLFGLGTVMKSCGW